MQPQTFTKQPWFKRIRDESYLGLGFALFALVIVFSQPPSTPVFATQTDRDQGDAKRGQDVFAKRCTGCHSLDDDKEGPRLRGIYDKKAATLSSTFKYSEALKNSNVTWDVQSLDQWMADPEKIVPNSDMFFRRASRRNRLLAELS